MKLGALRVFEYLSTQLRTTRVFEIYCCIAIFERLCGSLIQYAHVAESGPLGLNPISKYMNASI